METVERPGVAPAYGLAAALTACHFEVIPLKDTFERVAVLPAGSIVTVTASAARGMEPTMALAVRVAAAGYVTVPHLAARSIRDRAHLLDLVVRLEEAGVHRAFVVGGDAGESGEFPDGLSMLRAMDEMGHHFSEVGVPAYPQGHPLIEAEVLRQALLAKQGIASYMTTQLCFDPHAIDGWLRSARADGVRLPLVLGLPGPADMARVVPVPPEEQGAARRGPPPEGLPPGPAGPSAARNDRGPGGRRARAARLHVQPGPRIGRVAGARAGPGGPAIALRRDQPPGDRSAATSAATTARASPTIAQSDWARIGASGSVLIVMMRLAALHPTMCWMAPLMPHAM